MDQATLQSCYSNAILYYCDQIISGRRYYNFMDCAQLGADESLNIYILNWYPTDINQPTDNDLMQYTYTNVTNFYKYKYQLPFNLLPMFYQVSETDLSQIEMNQVPDGAVCFDNTNNQLKVYSKNSNTWITI